MNFQEILLRFDEGNLPMGKDFRKVGYITGGKLVEASVTENGEYLFGFFNDDQNSPYIGWIGLKRNTDGSISANPRGHKMIDVESEEYRRYLALGDR